MAGKVINFAFQTIIPTVMYIEYGDGRLENRVEKWMGRQSRRMKSAERSRAYSRCREQKLEFWKEFHKSYDEDYDFAYILKTIQFKLKWMVFYWDNFAVCANGGRKSRQIKLAVKLIDIILNDGLDRHGTEESLPYVNTGNKNRFYDFKIWHQPGFYRGLEQEVRFRKAYCIFFELLKQNLLNWWD